MISPAPLINLILLFTFRMEASLEHRDGVSCSLNLLSRAGYQIPNLDVSDLGEEGACTHYLGDSVHANSLRRLMPVEDRSSV